MIVYQKTLYFPIFSPWLHLGQIILRAYACKGAYKRHQALTVVNYVLSVSTITTTGSLLVLLFLLFEKLSYFVLLFHKIPTFPTFY